MSDMADLCATLNWNPGTAATGLASYAGVCGSLTLTAIVILMGHDDLAETRIGAILLFTVALFEMGSACIVFSIFAGEQDCVRSYVEMILAAPPLSVGSVTIITGVAWMFDIFEGDTDLERVSRTLVYAVVVVGLSLHVLLAWNFLGDMARVRAWSGRSASPLSMLAVLAAAIALVLTVAVYRPAPREQRMRALRHTAHGAIALVLLQLLLAVIFHVFSYTLWTPPFHRWLVYTVASSSLVTPVVGCMVLVRCLPRS